MTKSNVAVANESDEPFRYPTWVEAQAARASFVEHLRLTNAPEDFPGLSKSKPSPKDAPFLIIVKDFTVDLSRRAGGEMLPCAACGTSKKFITGCLAYYPEERVLRVVGNDCGNEQRAEANAEYTQRTNRAFTSEYLLQNLPKVDAWLMQARSVQLAAEHAQALSAQVRRKAKTFHRVLMKEAKEGGGDLTKFVLSEDANGRGSSHRVVLHRPTGMGFLRPSYEPNTKLALVIARLSACHFGDEEGALEWLIEHAEEHEELGKLAIVLRSAIDGLHDVRTLISVARDFLKAENMLGIDRWAYDAGHHAVRAQWSASRIILQGPSQNSRSFSTALVPDYALLESAN